MKAVFLAYLKFLRYSFLSQHLCRHSKNILRLLLSAFNLLVALAGKRQCTFQSSIFTPIFFPCLIGTLNVPFEVGKQQPVDIIFCWT